MPSYSSHNRPTIHDRRQSMMTGHGKLPNTPPTSDKSRPDYSAQGHPSLAEEVSSTIHASQPSVGAWDPAQPSAQSVQPVQDNHAYSTVQTNLPPLSEALASSPSMAVSPPMQTQQATLSNMNNVVASSPNFYAPNPYLDMQAPVNVYSQDQLDNDPSKMQQHGMQDRHQVSGQSMVPQDSNATSSSYVRRVTYPFVSSLDNGTGLVMSNVIPSEPAGSSPLNSHSPFAHGGLVGANSVSVQGMPRASSGVDYMDSLGLQQQVHAQAQSHHHHAQAAAQSQSMHPIAWSQNGGGGSDMSSVDGSVNGSKVYSFVPLSGVNSKKRPRRRFDEIERLYVCNWGDCEKAYGTLNHLNAHVNMQKHGPKRLPAEFKELRKAWRKHKRAEEEAAKQAAAFHQQQTQTQQAQLQQQQQQSLCDPVLSHMHPTHHQLAMHAMTHHQPHQLPHPHAHPNQHPHQHPHPHAHHSQHHNHPMGF
ncbi:hypothetical protein BGX27_010770 [Mortierella sp. AM989]|nr:hypothetical protein BGX27_010770 [Mortierella sp. AM989]